MYSKSGIRKFIIYAKADEDIDEHFESLEEHFEWILNWIGNINES